MELMFSWYVESFNPLFGNHLKRSHINMVMDTSPFAALMIAFPLIFVMHCLQDQNRKMHIIYGCFNMKFIFTFYTLIQLKDIGYSWCNFTAD